MSGYLGLWHYWATIALSMLGLYTLIENPVYSNPLPHVLMLTAIVVGVATTAVGLSLIVRIREEYGTSEDDEIRAIDREAM